MLGITSVSINGIGPQRAAVQNTGLQVEVAHSEAETAPGAEVDASSLRDGVPAQAAKGSEDSGDHEPAHIKQLREMIKQLQEQLIEEQKQLTELMSREMKDSTRIAMVTAKQASIATISGQIMALAAQLVEALTKSGGSSAGGMVSTQV